MELLLQVVNYISADPNVDPNMVKRGDVIFGAPDGWPWSTLELTNPDWRIIRVSGLDDDTLGQLTSAELNATPGERPSIPLLFRQRKLDIDGKLPPQVRNFLARPRSGNAVDLDVSLAQVKAAITLKR